MSEMPPSTVPPRTPPPPPGGSYTPPPPTSGGAPAGGDRTLMVVLSYLWILALIPLLMKKDDREVQWHAKNGLCILAAEIILAIVVTILQYALPDVVSCGLGIVNCVLWCAFLVIRIIAIVKGVGGQRFRVPMISDFADKF